MNPDLREYLAAPESVRAEFDRRLVAEIKADTDWRRWHSEVEDDDPTPPRQPEEPLRRPVRWDARWQRRATRRRTHPQPQAYDRDALLALDLREMWEKITGEEVPRHGRVTCPFPGHDDRNPACSVRESDWRCFACNKGGTIIDLAAIVFEIEPTGAGYFEIRDRLAEAA